MNSKTKPHKDPETVYANRLGKFEHLWKKQLLFVNRVSWLRLLMFLLIIILFYEGLKTGVVFWYAGSVAALIFFLWLVKRSVILTQKKEHYRALADINRNELNALHNNISAFENGAEFIDRNHPFSFDLDLFGPLSVFQFINRSYTETGKKMLASFLRHPLTDNTIIIERQAAIKELSVLTDWRQNFQAYAMTLKQSPGNEKQLLKWLHDKQTGIVAPFYRILALTLPVISLVLFFLTFSGLIVWQIPVYFLLIPLIIVGTLLKTTQKFNNLVTSALKTLRNHKELIRAIETGPFKTANLSRAKEQLTSGKKTASQHIRKLGNILDAFDSRNNIFVGVVLNALLLWDIHCLLRFEKWKNETGEKVQDWIRIIGETDALASLGTLAYNQPGYTFPVISENREWIFSQTGHPLIPSGKRVNNDLKIQQEGKIFIVTGPNMAGKSTFLRAIGVNLVLAMAGAPVCAGEMIFYPNFLFTSMRMTDSLQKNESYFYSELKRLQTLLEKAKGSSVLFLLDEILKGTNSTDKSNGSVAFIRQLIKYKATGLIATHDLSLGILEKTFPDTIVNQCFEAQIVNNELVFDYKLHDGLTQNMNATFLMKKMGIIEE